MGLWFISVYRTTFWGVIIRKGDDGPILHFGIHDNKGKECRRAKWDGSLKF